MTDPQVIEFLRESNNIEGVWDDLSLQQAIYAWDYLIAQEELTPAVILKTHKILMLHQPLKPNEKGYFRKEQVWVGGRECMRWEKLYLAIDDWCEDAMDVVTSAKTTLGYGQNIQLDHIEFEKIHPFIDGNGRTGRMLMNWQRVKAGLPIKIIKNAEKKAYYTWFV